MSKEIKISELCSLLQEEYYADLEVENTTELRPSNERIKQLVFGQLHQENHQQEVFRKVQDVSMGKGYIMKRKISRVLIAAALVCLLGITAFAATGGMEYFKSIFGDSIENVGNNVWSPMISDSDDNYRMTVESMLTDGYKTDIILSLEDLKNKKIKEYQETEHAALFTPMIQNIGNTSFYCNELSEYGTKSKKYYHLNISAMQSYEDSEITIVLSDAYGPLSIKLNAASSTGAKHLDIQKNDGNYTVESIQLSPLGVLVIGSEQKASGGLPTMQINLVMKDGRIEELVSKQSFDSGDGETVSGGGSAVVSAPGQPEPLVTLTEGARNPGGKVITTATFSRILNLNEVKFVTVNGEEYPVTGE